MLAVCNMLIIATLLLVVTSVSALNSRNFEWEENLDREKLTNYLSSVLCSIDLKSAHIYFELESAGTFVDGVVAESSRCSPPTLTIITYEKDGQNVVTNTTAGSRLVILIANKELDFDKSMYSKLIRIRQKFNFELFYMIVSEVKMSAGHEILLKTIYKHFNLLNVVVVAMENDSSAPTVITYNPFNNTIIRLPNKAYQTNQLFFDKVSNMFGSPINIVQYKDLVSTMTRRQGLKKTNFNYDVLLPDLISSAMNATLILKNPNFGRDLKRGNNVGNVDLTINGRSYESSVILGTGIEATHVLRRDDLCLLVRYNRSQNTFKIIYRTVHPFVWLAMIAVIFQAWVSLFALRWAQSLAQRWKHVFIFDLFGFHMNQGLTHMPKKVPPRLIIASCLIYCLVIKSIYESLLYTSMAKTREKRLSTIVELLDSNQYEIIISNGLYNISRHHIDHSPIKNHFTVVEHSEFMQRLDSNLHYAYVFRRRVATYFEDTNIVKGVPAYYTMDECVVPFAVTYYVKQGSPFLDQINQVLRVSEESGLYGYWQLVSAYEPIKQNRRLFVHRPTINFEQLIFVYQTLFYGHAIATAAFVVEWWTSKFKRDTNNSPEAKWFRFHRIKAK